MKKHSTDPNPYKAFNEFMIRQSVKEARGWKIEDNDQNDLRATNSNGRGRSVDLEFYDSETEEFYSGDKPYVFNNSKKLFYAAPLSSGMDADNNTENEKKKGSKEKKWSNDSPDREGYSEKREDVRRRKSEQDKDGLQSAEDADSVLVVRGKHSTKLNLRHEEFSARRSG